MATYTGTGAAESIQPGLVSPTVVSNGAPAPGAADDVLDAQGGADTLDGGGGSDQLFGGAGDDRLIWNFGGGTDLFEGGADTDTAEINGGAAAESFTISANGTRVRFDGLAPVAFILDIGTTEKLVVNMGGGNDSITATGNLAALIAVTIDGGAGNDTLSGSNGLDVLFGGADNDLVVGRQGNDTIFLGDGDDVAQWFPGDASDIVEGGAGTDTLDFSGSNANEIIAISANGARVLFTRNVANIVMDLNDVEQITFSALGGTDTIVVNDLTGTDVTRVNLDLGNSASASDGAADNVVVNGGAGNDTLSVSTGAAALVVVSFADSFDVFRVNGLAGNDTIVATGFDFALTIDGGTENDTVSYASAAAAVTVDLVNPSSNEGAAATHSYISIESIIGSAFDDLLIGSSASNTLDGGGGADYLQGRGGDDTYFVDNAGDVIIELANGGANDQVFAGISYALSGPARIETLATTDGNAKAAINLTGNNFAQSIFGNAGANKLKGLGGDDFLFGGKGKDSLDGGAGLDSFVFNTKLSSGNIDTIANFRKAEDTILLDDAIFTKLAVGALSKAAFYASNSGHAHDKSDRILYEKDTGKLFYDKDGSGSAHAVQFAVLSGHPSIGHADFLIV